jgi:hypothetical protein
MPIKFRNTNNLPTGASGYSVSFDGTSQYLNVPASSNWAFGTGDFTVEWWQYMTSQPAHPRVFAVGTYPSTWVGVSIEGGTFYVWENGVARFNFSLTAGGYLNQWIHFAISRASGTTRVFKNGTQIGSSYADSNDIANGSTILAIAQETAANAGSYFPGKISDFRILKGTGLYTSAFTAPTTPLTAIANTVLLTCNAATIVDGSTNNYTITNVNGATVSNTVPFPSSPASINVKIRNQRNNSNTSYIKLR